MRCRDAIQRSSTHGRLQVVPVLRAGGGARRRRTHRCLFVCGLPMLLSAVRRRRATRRIEQRRGIGEAAEVLEAFASLNTAAALSPRCPVDVRGGVELAEERRKVPLDRLGRELINDQPTAGRGQRQ